MNNDRFKFRIWDKFHNNFIFFDLTQGMALTEAEINKSEQSTGLSDKNGKLIYFSDLVKTQTNRIYQVVYDEEDYSIYLKFISGAFTDDKYILLSDMEVGKLELCGNTHEVKE